MKQSILKISQIIVRKEFYPRENINERVVAEYAKEMKYGCAFPNIYVALFEKQYYLIDGRHRLEAYKINGEQFVQCDVKANFINFEQIYLASVRANLKHGLRLRMVDKIKIAHKLTQLRCEIGDISKLLKLDVSQIERITAKKIHHIFIKDKIKSGEIPAVIKEKIPETPQVKVATVDDDAIRQIQKQNKSELELYELQQIYEYLSEHKFDESREVDGWLHKIKKVLHKKFPKL